MTKRKLARFAAIKTYRHVFEPPYFELFDQPYFTRGVWHTDIFRNSNPLVVEVGCGKGEYTVGLAQRFGDKNFVGVDVKGARIWCGAKTVDDEKMTNAAFVRTRAEFLASVFAPAEVSEIWITFPDPQPNKPLKRLSSSRFLEYYTRFLQTDGIIHLKTDSRELFDYTCKVLDINNITPIVCTADLYASTQVSDILSIRTFYENQFIARGCPITYLKFSLGGKTRLLEPEDNKYAAQAFPAVRRS